MSHTTGNAVCRGQTVPLNDARSRVTDQRSRVTDQLHILAKLCTTSQRNCTHFHPGVGPGMVPPGMGMSGYGGMGPMAPAGGMMAANNQQVYSAGPPGGLGPPPYQAAEGAPYPGGTTCNSFWQVLSMSGVATASVECGSSALAGMATCTNLLPA